MKLTVQKLITELQQFDPDAIVMVHSEGVASIEEIYDSSGVIVLDAEYYGQPIIFNKGH
ncbi:MAG: hypothetical protein V3V68_05295 [Nitrosomonadaceae bacterium]